MATGTEGINSMTYEHLDLIHALDMSFFVVITKIENTSPDATFVKLKAILSTMESSKVPVLIRSQDDVITVGAKQFPEQVVPIFYVSNVTGDGLDLLTRFLFLLSPGISNAEKERLEQEPCEFLVDEIFKVGEAGPVAGGLLRKGILTENMNMTIGPLQDGTFHSVTVHSIHRNKAPCRIIRAGQSGSIAFKCQENLPTLRSGMILLYDNPKKMMRSTSDEPFGSIFFQVSTAPPRLNGTHFIDVKIPLQAKISVLFHANAIYEGYQTTVHIGNIRQTAVIEGIMGCGKMGIGTNQEASVLFRLMCHPEYVASGQRILFREGRSKGIGVVTQVFPLNKQFS